MELTAIGRLVAWLAVSLLIVGFLLSNTLILFFGTMLLLYLLFEGISFHRAVESAKDSIELESHPSRIETAVGRQARIRTVVANHSHSGFHISRFSRNFQHPIDEKTLASQRLALGSSEVQRIETLLSTRLPGNSKSSTSTIVLEGRGSLFKQSVRIRDQILIIAQPLISRPAEPIEVGVLADLAVDYLRRGKGTELAGIRPHNFLDDFRRINWKATARTGRLMASDSFLEKDPTIILMIDLSLLETSRRGAAILPALLGGTGNLLAAFRPTSPVGLILYDRREVIANIEARQGVIARERILHTVLERVNSTPVPASIERPVIRSYTDLAKETSALMKESVFTAKTKAYWERFSSFASFILPFYKRAESKHFERLRRQGAFKAFEIICAIPEPVLVVVISRGETNLDGLAEGAKNARTLNHQVVLAILAAAELTKRNEILSDLQRHGVGILRCSPEELSRAIDAEILKLGHNRTIPVEAAR